MADESGRVNWFTTDRRALFPMEGIRLSRSLQREIRRGDFEIRFDTCFSAVMQACRRPDGNWINEELIRIYSRIHAEGWGHCCEIWKDGELAGGVYGIALGSCFSAESMFHRQSNASKLALWALIEKCRELGFTLFDAQVMNPHLESLGAYEVPSRDFLEWLHRAMTKRTSWDAYKPCAAKADLA